MKELEHLIKIFERDKDDLTLTGKERLIVLLLKERRI